MGVSINDDEVCFITMYLAGAMERARLHPRRRALVVCPSGMATAWVLVSRIQAEFPELELVEVLSESGYEALSHDKFDLVITTITLKEINAPGGGGQPPVVGIRRSPSCALYLILENLILENHA